MDSELEVVVPDKVLPPRASLDELRDIANNEHALVEEALGQALDHVIKSGEALSEIRDRFDVGEWGTWAETNFKGGRLVAGYYMRIAEYKDLVSGLPNVSQAMKSLQGLPALRRPGGITKYSDEVKSEARELSANGMSNAEIGRILGIHKATIRRWVDPEALRRHREYVKERGRQEREKRLRKEAEAEQRRREREARRVGGALSEVYSLAHKLEAPLALAHREAADPKVRKELTDAIRAHHHVIDHVVKALGMS